MVDTRRKSHVCRGGNVFERVAVRPNAEVANNMNGVAFDIATGSPRLHGDGLLTYKRRRGRKISRYSVSQPTEESVKHLDDPTIPIHHCSLKYQRNMVLEPICQSLDSEGGLKKCIRNALPLHPHPGGGSKIPVEESVHSCEVGSKCSSQMGTLHDGLQNAKTIMGMASSGPVNESNHVRFTDLCSCSFIDIIMSEKFAQLCSLLLENFKGMKAIKLFDDLNCINSRMKERSYESSPLLFQLDMQEIWMQLQKFGSDITDLAKCLKDKTRTSFHEQIGISANCITQDGKHELNAQESNRHMKPDDAHTCNCKHCREKADERNSLVCDSCEEIYHIYCIKPAIKEIPTENWYCTNCTTTITAEYSHENCIACDRLNASKFPYKEMAAKIEESPNEGPCCKFCRGKIRNDEEYRICGHLFCLDKSYHVKCLAAKQLVCYGPCWYCPSCLCTACFTDQDDDKIVLCDGCDHAYHIYCMHPARHSIPKGKWFCQKCQSDILHIREARRSYASDTNLKGNEIE